jgi:hypothetical protein
MNVVDLLVGTPAPRTLRESLFLVASGAAMFGLFAAFVKVASFVATLLVSLLLVPACVYTFGRGVYFSLLIGRETVPESWRSSYTCVAVLGVWLAWLSVFARDGASLGRHQLDAWAFLWRAAWCLGVFGFVRGMVAKERVVPRLKAYIVVISVVGVFVVMSAGGAFSGPPEDDPFDVPEPMPVEQSRARDLFLYVTLSLAAIAGVAKAPQDDRQF